MRRYYIHLTYRVPGPRKLNNFPIFRQLVCGRPVLFLNNGINFITQRNTPSSSENTGTEATKMNMKWIQASKSVL